MTWESLSSTKPVARRDHECQLCEWPIPTGTVYIKNVGLFDGDFWTYKAHPICDAILSAIDTENATPDEGTPDPLGFRQLLAHVVSVENVPYQLPTRVVGFKVALELLEGEFDWSDWFHWDTDFECPRCAA